MTLVELNLHEAQAERERRRLGEQLQEEAERLKRSLRLFMREAWHTVIPGGLIPSWHIDCICDHLEAAYARELPRLVITIQPGALKSSLVSVFAPAWRWAAAPWEQIVSSSYRDDLATRDTRRSRTILRSGWFQARFGDQVRLSPDENLKTRYSNVEGGYRVATHVGGGTGERGSVLILDDPHNAQDAMALSESALDDARDWWGNTWASRLNASVDDPGVKIVIGQRVHERDLIGFILDGDQDAAAWTHLCLPAHYDPKHPFVYPDRVPLPSGRVITGDVRRTEGELLAPAYVNAARLAEVTAEMSERVKEAQYEQRPTPRVGAILKRTYWRFYDPALLNDERFAELPAPSMIVTSWDTSFKAKATSDKVGGTCWLMHGGDMYLLRVVNGRMSLQATKDAMRELRGWAVGRWPNVPHYLLIEKAANGPEITEQLQREIQGVLAVTVSGDKKLRAEAASPALESGNVFVPGFRSPELDGYDPARTPADVQAFIEQLARFKGVGAEEDDLVDSFSQAVNWMREKAARIGTGRVAVPRGRRIGDVSVRQGR